MEYKEQINIIGFVINLFALFIVLYFQFKEPQTGIIFFLGIVVLVVIYFIVSYPLDIFKKKFNQINFNTKDLNEIKKDLNNLKDKFELRKEVSDLKSKMNLLELLIFKKKKALIPIDPRIIILLLILLFLFLYLKSKGYFG